MCQRSLKIIESGIISYSPSIVTMAISVSDQKVHKARWQDTADCSETPVEASVVALGTEALQLVWQEGEESIWLPGTCRSCNK